MSKKLAVLAGARPNFMKVAPLMAAMAEDSDLDPVLIHTGQHYDDAMSGSFLRDLQIPPPKHHLQVGSGTHAQQTAEIMKRLEPVLIEESAEGVIVVGDVNSTVAGALVGSKLGMAVIHAEAGLRSFDRTMPEEINRMVTDAISDLLLVTEESGRVNLLKEGHDEKRIVMVGNLMVDSLRRHLEDALKTDIVRRLGLEGKKYGLVTLHRPANVDDQEKLAEIVGALATISTELPLYWPVHPRTRARIQSGGLALPERIHLLEPLSYFDFLHMQAKAETIFTDSGGIQEESTVLGVKCLTLRENTERPATIEYGTNRLAGTSAGSILSAWDAVRGQNLRGSIPPLWDGQAGVRCHAALRKFFALPVREKSVVNA
ncbi:MAG TPA: UDP-N-acetylglucosamine 2-epimerase (non-hydrolyzing) [Bryobacteraceae bacterium]|nr:UDP-N-acetylglucosamine 2-epimerase (non-hydrolyzing) [Bryobacteraceae bacterium]